MENTIVVSERVKSVLADLFPDVNPGIVEWSWEVYNKIVEAEFKIDGREHEIEITVTGHHLLTEQEISVDEVPANVMETVSVKYPGRTVSEAEMVTWSTGEVFYELDLSDGEGEEEMEIHVSAEGVVTTEGEDL